MKILIDINHPAHVHYFKKFSTNSLKLCEQYDINLNSRKKLNELDWI